MQWLKDSNYQRRSKNKNQLYVVYKKPILNINIYIYGLKADGWRKIYYDFTNSKKAEGAILILDKVKSRVRKFIRNRVLLYNHKGTIFPRKYHDY